jgi:hypothetical protein
VNYRNGNPPIICDMTGAADTISERMAEYRRLFTQSLLGRDRTGTGIRFRFRADKGLEDWVRDLAGREQACCAFFSFTVTANDDEVWWDASVIDDDMARQILDEFYRLPDTFAHGLRNVSPQVARANKRVAVANVAALSRLVLHSLAELGEHDAGRFAAAAVMVTGAVWSHAQPSAAMLAAYQADPALASMRLDFTATLREVLEVLIAGLPARSATWCSVARLLGGHDHGLGGSAELDTPP